MAELDLRKEELRELGRSFIRDAAGEPGEAFGMYAIAASSPWSALPRAVEHDVFFEYFGNEPEVLEAEYQPYEDATLFVCVMDHLRGLPAGRIAHQQVTAEGSDDFRVEFVGTGHSCSIASFHMPSSDYLVWIDLEMTGLKPDTDVIIEMATIVTDANLNIVTEGPVIAIHQPDEVLEAMDDWNKRTHGASGLLTRVRESKYTMASAEQRTLEVLRVLVEPNSSPMCGNSICQDRRFLARHMPTLEKFFHYRNLDVSTVKELARRWAPGIIPGFSKQGTHKALDGIQESIRELAYYRQHFFAPACSRP